MTLLTEIQAKCSPELIASRDHRAMAVVVSAGRTRMDTTTKFASLGISERFPPLGGLPGPLAAELVLQKLEGFAVTAAQSPDPTIKLLAGSVTRQMGHLKGSGIALGSPAVEGMLNVIVGAGAMTQAEVDALIGIARKADPVTVRQVMQAMEAL
jgi:hypothetical protein